MELDLPEKRYYTIGEVAKTFQVNTSLLRFWEKEFKEIQPKKKSSGVRKYTPQDIQNIKLIFHLLKEKGMTIEGAKNHLKNSKSSEENKMDVLKKLEHIKKELENLRDNL
ncbi:MerR family transcriptional regulator [Flavobacteriaceae bacterium]|nr:MerR family transcriptional regulator [Flavobacteriaceae bacterium]MDB4153267.1 MerR family transcriptional regulator [Flavobacteriaceae bacterium]MDB9988615.1 MerR family transcriptional regulator [Flavobacteriaceae bacterium]|tara:strand:+ start:897 stop:1226 length:330 start_codon:yes stop_codon:yes gene_type:complete